MVLHSFLQMLINLPNKDHEQIIIYNYTHIIYLQVKEA